MKNMNGVIWKKINGFPNYFISNNGDVSNGKKILKPFPNKDGRLKINLYDKNKKLKQFFISRLVALHFIKNPNKKPNVDHIDRNLKNNNVKNLRWVNQSENLLNENTIKYRSMMIGKERAVDVAQKNNIPKETFYRRIRNGWSISEASMLPQQKYTFIKRKHKKGEV